METNQKNADNMQHQLECDIADLKVLCTVQLKVLLSVFYLQCLHSPQCSVKVTGLNTDGPVVLLLWMAWSCTAMNDPVLHCGEWSSFALTGWISQEFKAQSNKHQSDRAKSIKQEMWGGGVHHVTSTQHDCITQMSVFDHWGGDLSSIYCQELGINFMQNHHIMQDVILAGSDISHSEWNCNQKKVLIISDRQQESFVYMWWVLCYRSTPL